MNQGCIDRWPDGAPRERHLRGGDRGAALVEFGIVAVLLATLLFGTIEFGWALNQQLDVRHGARETARLAAVNYTTSASTTPGSQTTALVAEACGRMDADAAVLLTLTRPGSPAAGAIGDTVSVTVEKPLEQLTGFFSVLLGGKTLHSTVQIRLEQQATWANTSDEPCP